MFSRPILVFSNYCQHSKNFLSMLLESPLSQEFIFVNVDVDPNTKRRSDDFLSLKGILTTNFNYKLTSVPTIIVENGEFILKDADAFEWLKHTLETINNTEKNKEPVVEEPAEISGFNPNEMVAFSDMYSTFGLNTKDPCMDAKNQCYQFLGQDFSISTPPIDDQAPQAPQMQMPQQKTVRFSNDVNSRNKSSGSGGSKSNKKGYGTEKEKELNSKYEEMMLARQMMDKARIPERT
jgi:hypothetical protein